MQNYKKTRFGVIWKKLRKDFLKKNNRVKFFKDSKVIRVSGVYLNRIWTWFFCNYDLIVCSWDASVRNIATISMLYDQLNNESACADSSFNWLKT